MPPRQRATDNGWLKYIPWAVVFALVSVAVLAGETRFQVKNNTAEIGKTEATVDTLVSTQASIRTLLEVVREEQLEAQRDIKAILRELRNRNAAYNNE